MRISIGLFIFFVVFFSQPISAEKIFRYSIDGTPDTLSPLKANKSYSNEIITAIFDTLYEYKYLKSPWELKPCLAKGMPQISRDGKVYTIKIKKGVKFTDDPAFKNGKGREVTAFDVIYSFKRHFHTDEVSHGRWLWENRIAGIDQWRKNGCSYEKKVEGLRVIDRYTLQIILKQPYPQLLYTLAMGYSAIVAQEVIEYYKKEIEYHPVGSGPFILKFFSNKKCILVKNPDYRKEIMDLEGYTDHLHRPFGIQSLYNKRLPLIDRVEITYSLSPLKQWQAFEKGDSIQFSRLPHKMINRVLKWKKPLELRAIYAQNFHYHPYQTLGLIYCDFNMSDPIIGYNPDPIRNERNKALRIAISKGFNWSQRIKHFHLGIGEPFVGMIPPGLEGSTSGYAPQEKVYNPKEAKRLLERNGWTANTLPVLEFHSMLSPMNIQGFEQFCQWMKQIGYPRRKLKFNAYRSHEAFSIAIKEKKCMFYIQSWQMDYPDPQNIFHMYYSAENASHPSSSTFKNSQFDMLYEKASLMPSGPERSEIYQMMNHILIDESPCIAGFSPTRIYMWHKRIILFYRANPISNIFKYVDIR